MKRLLNPVALLAVLFIGPLVLAVLLYSWRGTFGGFGQLPNPDREMIEAAPLLPPIALVLADGTLAPNDGMRSRWSLIYARMPACEAACREALARLSQVYQALGTDRVQLIFLAPADELRSLPPVDFRFAALDAADGAELVELIGRERLSEGRYLVVDPLGNFILSYPADADQGRLLEDLERLLDVSRIG